jgi:hypothetical protein
MSAKAHSLRMISGTLAVLVPFFAVLYLLGARAPLSEPKEDPRLVALKRDPVALAMVSWIKDEISNKMKEAPSNVGCWRTTSEGTCAMDLYNGTIYVKVWIDQGGAHWRPLKGLKA